MKPLFLHYLSVCIACAIFALAAIELRVVAASFPSVPTVEIQPMGAQVRRLVQALDYLGIPLSETEKDALRQAIHQEDTAAIQDILDPRCLFGVSINPEMRVKVSRGPALARLMEHGWRLFLVKVHNESGTTAELKARSPNAAQLHNAPANEVNDRWLDLEMFNRQPLNPTLSGLNLEYRIIQLYSRDSGKREAKFTFNVGQGTQDLGFRNEVDILFDCEIARQITLHVLDQNGEPTTGAFVIRDQLGRVYPSTSKRLAPDFSFHHQVYRADGETIRLPEGTYTVEFSRGPESIPENRKVTVDGTTTDLRFQVRRWVDPAAMGWWSGDHHIHAAGCAHYTDPTEGVHAVDMIRHCLGEDLKVGANLTWGPCFDYQKQFFTGKIDPVSTYPYLLRYDIEVSGFGSHESGHLCLLRLRDQIYPGGNSKHHWPKLCLNTLKWAQKQGAVCGPAHSGWGLQVETDKLPNYIIPPFNGIGANEYIVDVTHEVEGPNGERVPAVDFMSTVDTPYVWELNIWYHTLNVGYRTRISGETDFPCIYGERVGLGRSYVRLGGRLDYNEWCQGISEGKAYVSDGLSHLIDFKINGTSLGDNGSEVLLEEPGSITATVKVAARLNEKPNPDLRDRAYQQKPYWHLERARMGDTRQVPVELVVNGEPVAVQQVTADGFMQELQFKVPVKKSSWVAVRILPSSHTNPIFVLVDGKPIRASQKSAEWCLKSVDQCWSQKERFIDADEMEDAKKAYAHARQAYRRLLAECRAQE